jgi:hypothetical protein
MNEPLLVKWIRKIHLEPDTLWFRILKAKYIRNEGFLGSKIKGSSQFWQELHKVKHLFKWGAIFKVENGKLCRFWQDSWIMEVPLKIAFADLYRFADNAECTVAECWVEDDWYIEFKRSLSSQEYVSWLDLKSILGEVSLSDRLATISWALNKSRIFSTESLYRFITDRGAASKVAGLIWKCKIPLKIIFFLWQVFNNKLQVGQFIQEGLERFRQNAVSVVVQKLLIIFSLTVILPNSFGVPLRKSGSWVNCLDP